MQPDWIKTRSLLDVAIVTVVSIIALWVARVLVPLFIAAWMLLSIRKRQRGDEMVRPADSPAGSTRRSAPLRAAISGLGQ